MEVRVVKRVSAGFGLHACRAGPLPRQGCCASAARRPAAALDPGAFTGPRGKGQYRAGQGLPD